jgi:hypothetical protein
LYHRDRDERELKESQITRILYLLDRGKEHTFQEKDRVVTKLTGWYTSPIEGFRNKGLVLVDFIATLLAAVAAILSPNRQFKDFTDRVDYD